MKQLHRFCTVYNVTDPFPLTEHILCLFFVTYLAKQGLAPQMGKAYLAALRNNAQILLGLPNPREQKSLLLLKRVQAGISRTRLQRNKAPPRPGLGQCGTG